MPVRDKAFSSLGSLQSEVLMWVGVASGIASYSEDVWRKVLADIPKIKPKKPAEDTSEFAFFKRLVWAFHNFQKTRPYEVKRLDNRVTSIKKMMDAGRQIDPLEVEHFKAFLKGQPRVKWSAERFLGRPPSRNESAKLAITLRKLSDRGYVIREDGNKENKKIRTYAVRLTDGGAFRCAHHWTIIEEKMGAEAYTIFADTHLREKWNLFFEDTDRFDRLIKPYL